MSNYLGFDFGGTTVKYGIVDDFGKILTKDAFDTPKQRDEIIQKVTTIAKAAQNTHNVMSIGVSMPGVVQANGYLTTAGAIKCLYETNFKTLVETATGLQTTIENDANAAAIAEHWLGAAQGISNYLCLVLGTGFGGGIVINHQVYRGGHGMAGEFGWMVTKDYQLTRDIEQSSLNVTSAIVDGLCLQYTKAMREVNTDYPRVRDARVIFQAANKGEQLAKIILTQFYYDLATGIIDLIAAFDPEVILIGGGISANSDFIKGLENAVNDLKRRHKSLARLAGVIDTPVRAAGLSNDAGLIGAVYQSMRS